MRTIILLVVISAFFGSCNNNPNQPEINKVDSLLTILDSAQKELMIINPKALSDMKDTVTFDLKFLQIEYADTMSLDKAILVDAYGRTLKSISKFEKTFMEQSKDVEYSTTQLTDMKKDLESGILNKVSFNEFYPAEEESVARLMESNGNMKIWFESVKDSYEKRRGPVVKLMDEVKARKGF
ncbi:MAG: hypothetical protein KDC83_07365 [Flavobacteriales bacterium]|nr:hypothetical protein [Flavobacteriales bacterium]